MLQLALRQPGSGLLHSRHPDSYSDFRSAALRLSPPAFQLVFRPAIGFFKIVSLPLFSSLSESFPRSVRLSVLIVYLFRNKRMFVKILPIVDILVKDDMINYENYFKTEYRAEKNRQYIIKMGWKTEEKKKSKNPAA